MSVFNEEDKRNERKSAIKALKPNEARFVANYIKTGNVKLALTRAGYPSDRIDDIAPRILNVARIKKAVDLYLAYQCDKLELTKDSIVYYYKCIIESKIDDYLYWDKHGNIQLREMKTLAPEQMYAIEKIKKGKYGVEFSFKDKLKALNEFSKVAGLLEEKTVVIHKDETGLKKPRLEALTNEELKLYKQLVMKMESYGEPD